MKSICLALLLTIAAFQPANAQEPAPETTVTAAEIVVAAPKTAHVGELVIIDVSKSTADQVEWRVIPESKNFRVFESGRVAAFSSGTAGEFTFVIAAAKDGSVDVEIINVRLVVDGPASALTEKVATWCEAVKSTTKRDDALKLAQSFSAMASFIDTLTDNGSGIGVEEVISATAAANRKALGDHLDSWIPFLSSLGEELKAMNAADKLPDAKAHAALWREIAASLQQYADTL